MLVPGRCRHEVQQHVSNQPGGAGGALPPLSDTAAPCSLAFMGVLTAPRWAAGLAATPFGFSLPIRFLFASSAPGNQYRDRMLKCHSYRKLGSCPNAMLAIQLTGK